MKTQSKLGLELLLAGTLVAATGFSLVADQAQFTDVTTPVLAHPGYGTGIAWGDFDGDGDLDLATANGDLATGCRLFRNDGDRGFADVTPANLSATAANILAWADYDNDDDLDLLTTPGLATTLLRNDGDGVFTDVASGPLRQPGAAASWADYDGDGLVDIYFSVAGSSLVLAPNRLFRNLGGDVFSEVTTPPIDRPFEATGSSWADYDGDGDLDLLVQNTIWGGSNHLYRNDGAGTFVDVTAGPLKDIPGSSDSSWSDYDNDGDPDLLLSCYNCAPTRLLRNDAGTFVEVTLSILGSTQAGGFAWGDYDNDGDVDLYLGTAQAARLLRNEGEGQFSDVSPRQFSELGMRGGVWGDYDGDGDLDLFLNGNSGSPAAIAKSLFRNDLANGNHWLHLDLHGGPSNHSAIGARVTLVAGGSGQMREVSGNSETYGQDSLTVEFGLGTNTVIDSVVIRWPSGTLQTLTGVSVDQRLRVLESGATNQPPVISVQPAGTSVYPGEDVRLRVSALGTWPLGYQWRKDGVDLLNATNASLALTNVSPTTAGDYTVVVSNAFGSVTSDVARVTVTERPWPYFADFEGAVGPEWSVPRTETTPIGKRRFLGQFNNETVNLTLTALPPHNELILSLDLYLIFSWDGNDTGGVWPGQAGPDIWALTADGTRTLLHTTFLHDRPGFTQAFPEDHPGGSYPGRTGAAENNTLGYVWGDGQVMDSVYQLRIAFPHVADTVTLAFSAQGLEDPSNESWGLDNVRVELTPPPGTPYLGTELAPVCTIAPPGQGPVHSTATSGTRALVAVGDDSVALLDLKDPANPVWLGSWEPWFPPSAFTLAGNTAYIASYEFDFLSTVEIVDFTDPAKPVLKGYYDTEGYALDIAVAGNRLYVADDVAGLAIVDLSNPARPGRIGGYTTKRSFQRVEVSGRYAYVVDGDWLLILDVSDPGFPFRVGFYDLGSPVQALQVNWQTAYVLVGTGELRILDVSDPGSVRLVGTHRTWGVQSLAVSGKYAYLAKGNHGLEVVDLSDPAKPVWATGLTTTGSAEDVAVVGQDVLVASGDKGLSVYHLEQHISPPLGPPVLADGLLTLSWPAMEGVRLQRTPELVPAQWEDVVESEGTNTVRLAMDEATGFFRLAKGPKTGQWPSGLIAWWPGDGNATDVVGSHDGILRGDAAFAEGLVGQAFSLDGDGDFVEVADAPELNFGDAAFTVTVWVKLAQCNDEQVIIEKLVHGAIPHPGWGLTWLGFGSLCFFNFPVSDVVYQAPGVPVGTWVHLVARWNGEEAAMFLDGAIVASELWPTNLSFDSPSSLKIGHRGNPNDTPGSESWQEFYLNGLVDEVMLFNRALGDEEIRGIYKAGIAGMKSRPR